MSIRELLGLDGEGASSWAHLHIVNRMTFEPAEAATTDAANTTAISASTSQVQEATLEYPAWALVGPSLWEAMPSSQSAGTTSTTVTSRGASSGAQDVPNQQAYIDKLIHGLSAPDRLRAVHAQVHLCCSLHFRSQWHVTYWRCSRCYYRQQQGLREEPVLVLRGVHPQRQQMWRSIVPSW